MNNKGTKYGIILLLLILALTGANLLFGSVNIPAEAVWHILTGNEVEKASWSFIVWESRLPQAITALLCGMALAASGLMLQTTFNNPLADPSILGISSGSQFGSCLGHAGRRRYDYCRSIHFIRIPVRHYRSIHRLHAGDGNHPVLLHFDKKTASCCSL